MAVAERLHDYVHPLMAALQADPGAEADFWAKMERDRTPLIEPRPDRPGHSIVTYAFALPEGARHVVVQPGFGDAPGNLMAQVAGTRVCHASYSYRNDVRTSYSFAVDMPLVSMDDAGPDEVKLLLAFWGGAEPTPDPHGREIFANRSAPEHANDVSSFVSLPDAPDEHLACKQPGIARGRIDKHTFRSAEMGNERNVWVYTPPAYEADGEARHPVLLAFDGGAALTRSPVHRLLDGLIAEGRIRPAIAVFVDNPTPDSRNVELPCNEAMLRFLETELWPWLSENYRVSARAEDHFVTGASYGGLASMWVGFKLPHLFGNVIAQAPSLWWGPGFRMDVPRSAGGYPAEWLTEAYRKTPKLPVRYWVEIGLMEHPSLMLEPNRRMQAVMEEKGYDLTYSEPCGGHDTALWRGTLGLALAKMLAA